MSRGSDGPKRTKAFWRAYPWLNGNVISEVLNGSPTRQRVIAARSLGATTVPGLAGKRRRCDSVHEQCQRRKGIKHPKGKEDRASQSAQARYLRPQWERGSRAESAWPFCQSIPYSDDDGD